MDKCHWKYGGVHMETYTVEREFLNKLSVEELMKRIIQAHQEENLKEAG